MTRRARADAVYGAALWLVGVGVALANLPLLWRRPPVDSDLLEVLLSMWLDDDEDVEL